MKRASNSHEFNLENAGMSAARSLCRRKIGEVSPGVMPGFGMARPAAVGVSRADPILYTFSFTKLYLKNSINSL